MYNEITIIPLMIVIGISIKGSRTSKHNKLYILFFIYMFIITYIHDLSIFDAYSEGAYLAVILLIFSDYLFKNSNNVLKVVFLVWLITIGYAISSIIFGANPFSVANIDSEERELILNNGIVGSSASDLGIDLNYFSCGQAIGALITLMFIYYRNYFLSTISTIPVLIKKIVSNALFPILLYLLLGLEVWLVFRGLSRGALLVLLSGFLIFMLIFKKI